MNSKVQNAINFPSSFLSILSHPVPLPLTQMHGKSLLISLQMVIFSSLFSENILYIRGKFIWEIIMLCYPFLGMNVICVNFFLYTEGSLHQTGTICTLFFTIDLRSVSLESFEWFGATARLTHLFLRSMSEM